MLQNTFTFIPGIGAKTERSFWEGGLTSWDDFLQDFKVNGTSKAKRKVIVDYIQAAKKAIQNNTTTFFSEHLPQKEHWKLYKDFYNNTVFLDIETTGLSKYYDVITMIGTFDGKEVRVFIKDNNLKDIVKYLSKYKIIVTFNGSIFDLPFIKKEFPEISFPPIHLDLRFLLKSIGIKGSLKKIEQKLGIRRNSEVQQIDGREATVLWSRFLKNDNDSLRKLILYNIYDTVDLRNLMDFCYVNKIESEVLPIIDSLNKQQGLFEDNKFYIDNKLPDSHFDIPNVKLEKKGKLLKVLANDAPLVSIARSKINIPEIKLKEIISKIKENGYKAVSIGIDLTGSEEKPSGMCILDGSNAYLSMIKSNAEMITEIKKVNPAVISIDSPLSLPVGRDCSDDTCKCRKFGIMRECERILKRRGINVYPCLIPSMQKLTMRGMDLSRTLEKKGFEVIESYPGAAQDILGFPRKRINLAELEVDLMNMGIKPISEKDTITHDELDALTSALVGYFYLANMYEAIGNFEEKYLIIPEIQR